MSDLMEAGRLIVDVAVLPSIGMVGWLLKRAIDGVDGKIDKLESNLTSTVGRVTEIEKDLAVIKFQLEEARAAKE